jgi:kinesin family member 5
LEEAKKINQSLTSLGRVIKALSSGDSHVPFRDSKLTHLLRESLGGNSKTTLICTCSRLSKYKEESIQSLKFA